MSVEYKRVSKPFYENQYETILADLAKDGWELVCVDARWMFLSRAASTEDQADKAVLTKLLKQIAFLKEAWLEDGFFSDTMSARLNGLFQLADKIQEYMKS